MADLNVSVMTETDVLKLKVADLKKELKLRRLSVVGVKSELQERLQAAIRSARADDDEDDVVEDFVLEDDVLADDGKASDFSYQDELILNSPTATEVSPSKTTPDATVVPEEENKPTVAPSELVDISNVGPSEKNVLTITKLQGLSDKEKRELRAKKFNLPLPDDVKKKARAERFGTGNTVKTSSSTVLAGLNSTDALKKRAERFGGGGANNSQKGDVTKLNQRAERFGLNRNKTSTENDVMRAEKRKERFSSASQEDDQVKKKTRAARFGIATV